MVVIINFSNTRYENYVLGGMPGNPDGEWKLRYNSDWHGSYVDWEGQFSAEYPVTLMPATVGRAPAPSPSISELILSWSTASEPAGCCIGCKNGIPG